MKLDKVVNVRFQSTRLATALRFFHSQGIMPATKGELVRLTVDFMVDQLIKNNLVEEITSADLAHEMLSGHFGLLKADLKALRNLSLNLSDETEADGAADELEKLLKGEQDGS